MERGPFGSKPEQGTDGRDRRRGRAGRSSEVGRVGRRVRGRVDLNWWGNVKYQPFLEQLMQNGFSSYYMKHGSDSDEQVAIVVRLEDRKDGIEVIVSRKEAIEHGTSFTTKREDRLTLNSLSLEQALEIVKLLENWLRSESRPVMDTTIDDVSGSHKKEIPASLGRQERSATNEFESVTIAVSDQYVEFSYWHEADYEWKDVSIPAAEFPATEDVDVGTPRDYKNIEKLYSMLYDFFTIEYSGQVDYFKDDDSAKTKDSEIYEIERIFNRFSEIVIPLQKRQGDKEPLTMDQEADVQYLLHSLLKLYFDDVRREPHTDRHSSVSPRIDFLVQNETIGIEVKRASQTRQEKALRKELAEDKEQYRLDTNIDTLLVFVYDPEKQIENKAEFEASFEQDSPQMTTRVTVTR